MHANPFTHLQGHTTLICMHVCVCMCVCVRSITFNLGEPGAFHETVKWESSPKLVMLQEIVDITPFNLQH